MLPISLSELFVALAAVGGIAYVGLVLLRRWIRPNVLPPPDIYCITPPELEAFGWSDISTWRLAGPESVDDTDELRFVREDHGQYRLERLDPKLDTWYLATDERYSELQMKLLSE